MKKIIFFLIFISLSLKINFVLAYSSDPKLFVEELVNEAINKLSDKTVSDEEKSSFIETLALENVDIKALGLYTLGEIRKTTKEEKLLEYQKVFEKYFLKSLTSRLTDYSSNKFEILNSEIKSATYTIVNSRVVENAEKPEIKIDWRIYTKNPDKPLIRDLIVEGLSLARTQKEEFKSVIQNNNNDINALFKTLEDFINK